MTDPLDKLIEKAKVDIETAVQLALARMALGRIVSINPAWADRAKAALDSTGEE
ncbi:MAG TPA: hypothetical protein VKQ11_00720 [Candidatus Sulfotelmatobacter sp.]|nr:hypothetical protein [Candidatus Sulfotelmatobacter sp.]